MSTRIVVLAALLIGCPAWPVLAAPDVVHAEYGTGSAPTAVAFGEDARLGVVANAGDGTLSVLDSADPAGGVTTMTTCSAPPARSPSRRARRSSMNIAWPHAYSLLPGSL